MKDADRETAGAAADLCAPNTSGPSAGGTDGAITGDTARHRLNRTRALRLGELLGLDVVIDETGWLRGDIEIAYHRDRDNSLCPLRVHIAGDAPDEDVLVEGGPVKVCQRYNAALANLGQLSRDLAATVRPGQLAPGTQLAKVRRELDRLHALVAARQAAHMGHGIARLRTLVRETAYLEGRHAQLAELVEAAGAAAAWGGDTQDDVPLDRNQTEPREDS